MARGRGAAGAWFQNSAPEPGEGRVPAHEYRLSAAADARTGTLTQISAVAGALPIPECPLAADNLHRQVGVPLANLRRTAPASCAARTAVRISLTRPGPCARCRRCFSPVGLKLIAVDY
ncbi:DUF2889 domain-containing protein [Streptomyces hirsutus]|uniref:DUF2889 domain-containing protein n=1 Tax=Streptomyces hirsutus TaxID=35620 RepID=UPI00368C4CE2